MEDKVWNKFDENSVYLKNQEFYKNHILEQYKIYVEMADRISSRRNLANMFFLTLNTTILGVIGFAFDKIQLIEPKGLIIFPLIIVISLTIVWYGLLLSYRNLNSAKYKVIRHLSKELPSSPWSIEWIELGEGKSLKKYLPLTALEKFIPILFCTIYIMIAIFIIFLMK